MGAPRPGAAGDAWDGNGGEGGQSEVDAGGGGQSGPGMDGGVGLLPDLLPQLLLLCLPSRPRLAHQSARTSLRRAGGAEG